tara:strand:- start:12760 stop:13926 length:1167 start_codon:yes stop_codon:yes gene_type:complete
MFLPVALLLFVFIACDVLESSNNDLEVQEKENVAQVINTSESKNDEDGERHDDEDGEHHDEDGEHHDDEDGEHHDDEDGERHDDDGEHHDDDGEHHDDDGEQHDDDGEQHDDVKAIILIDKLNREVEIDVGPVRVVSLSPTATEMIYKAGGSVIARDASSRYPEQIMNLPTVGSAYTPNFEAIIAQEPDLIVIEALTQARFMRDLSRFGIPIFAVRATSLEDISDGIQSMGIIFNKEEEVNQVLIDMNKQIEEISERVNYSGDILILISDADRNLYAAKPESYAGLVADILNLKNVAAGMDDAGPYPGYTSWAGETAMRSDPGYIFTINPAPPPAPRLSQTLPSIPGFNRLTAIREERVKDLDPILFMQAPGPRIIDALLELVSKIEE